MVLFTVRKTSIESKTVAGSAFSSTVKEWGPAAKGGMFPATAHSPSARLNWDATPSMVTVKVAAVPNLQTLSCAVSSVVGGTATELRVGVVGSLPGIPDSPQATTSPATLNTARRLMDEAESACIFGPMSWRRGVGTSADFCKSKADWVALG